MPCPHLTHQRVISQVPQDISHLATPKLPSLGTLQDQANLDSLKGCLQDTPKGVTSQDTHKGVTSQDTLSKHQGATQANKFLHKLATTRVSLQPTTASLLLPTVAITPPLLLRVAITRLPHHRAAIIQLPLLRVAITLQLPLLRVAIILRLLPRASGPLPDLARSSFRPRWNCVWSVAT